MTEAIKGHKLSEVEDLFQAFHALLTSDLRSEPEIGGLGKLAVFSGVREFPVRVKCATLAWHTLRNALAGVDETAVTE
jgi:nitrogen fixation NifU-like protein